MNQKVQDTNIKHLSKQLSNENHDIISKNPEEWEILTPYTTDEEENQNITVFLNIPGIETKAHQSVMAQKALILEHLSIHYLSDHWIYVYSDGSSQDAVCNGGAGVSRWNRSLSATTGQLSTYHKSEQQAATQAMSQLINQAVSNTNIVFLIDCKSVLESVQNESQDNATRHFKHQFSIISRTNKAAFQWIPAHCGITGNESADKQVKQTSECHNTVTECHFQR